MGPAMTAERLWTPPPERVDRAAITKYRSWLERERGLSFGGYEELWRWSVEDLESFWASIWDFCGVIAHRPYDYVLDRRRMPGAHWFDGALVNYAEQSLWRAREPEWCGRSALVFESESRPRIELTWGQLGDRVAALAATLRSLGIRQGDRVCAYLPNIPESVIAMLATTSLGAIWSSAAPDMGAAGVLDRFRQIQPKVLVAVDGYRYGGSAFDRRDVLGEIVRGLPSLEALILVPHLDAGPAFQVPGTLAVVSFGDAVAELGATGVHPSAFRPSVVGCLLVRYQR